MSLQYMLDDYSHLGRKVDYVPVVRDVKPLRKLPPPAPLLDLDESPPLHPVYVSDWLRRRDQLAIQASQRRLKARRAAQNRGAQ